MIDRPRRRVMVPACLLAATALVAAALVIVSHQASAHHRPRTAAAPPVAVSPKAVSPQAVARPAAVRTTPTAHVVPHDVVRAAVPTAFTLSGPRFTIRAHVCAMPSGFPLDPPGEQHHTVCWVRKGFGYRPSSDSATSYVLGHSWGQDDREVLNQASALATRQLLHTTPVTRDGVPTYPLHALDGYRLTLRTANGVLTYRVHDAYGVDKHQLGSIRSTFDEGVRRRVVLITCAELDHVDYPYNVVVNAYLWSSRAASIRAS